MHNLGLGGARSGTVSEKSRLRNLSDRGPHLECDLGINKRQALGKKGEVKAAQGHRIWTRKVLNNNINLCVYWFLCLVFFGGGMKQDLSYQGD